jgi:superfamily I DNA/RNA helicase
MPTLVFDKAFLTDFAKLDGSVQQKVAELPGKFEQATHTGVHLEKLNAMKDDRIRTVRVDQSVRGVVVALGQGRYALLRVLPHDDAIAWAQRQKLAVNPVTGIVELVDVPTIAEQVERITPSPEVTAERPPRLFGDVPDKAFKQLGVDDELVPLLRRLRDEAELLAIASFLPKAQGDAVLLLADGKTPDEVWKELAQDYALQDERVDPDDLDAALARPGSRAEFIVTTNDEELRALLTGDFAAWRTFLHPSQRVLAEKPDYRGPAKVTGGAGTGKTVVAIHRARFLAQRLIEAGDTTGRVLVATYTTSLQRNLERTLRAFCTPEEHKRLHVATIDSVAFQTLAAEGQKVRPASNQVVRDLAEQAVQEAALDAQGLDARFLVAEWRHVVLGRDLRSLSQYATTPRPGRGRPLARAARKAVWEAIQRLTDALSERGYATYNQIAARAAELLKSRSAPPYRHVIVDEAQDLHPTQWRLVRAAVAPGDNDLFLVGDAHQRIYDSRVTLSSLGIETRGRSRRLKINYRTSQQILGWALGILTGESIDDLDGGVEQQTGYRSEFQGPPPMVRTFDTAVEEAAFVAETIQGWLADGVAPSAIGVVSRTHGDTTAVEHALSAADVPWSELGKGGKGVGVGTMHASKGLEFARHAVVGVSADRVPLPLVVTSEAEDASQHVLDLQRERCLLYVACTRARDALVVTSAGTLSELLLGQGSSGS